MSYHPNILNDPDPLRGDQILITRINPLSKIQPPTLNSPQNGTTTTTTTTNTTNTQPIPSTSQPNPFLINMFASGCGSVVTGLTMTPLDVLGKRIQAEKLTQTGSDQLINKHQTILHSLRRIIQREGISRLWTGLSTGLVMAVPNTVTYFSAYELLRQLFVHKIPHYQHSLHSSTLFINHPLIHAALESSSLPPFLAGVCSRLFCTTLVAPLELVRTRQQTFLTATNSVPPMSRIFKDIIYNTARTRSEIINNGIETTKYSRRPRFSNLYRGIGTTLLRDVPFSALYWTFNERSKAILTESNLFCQNNTITTTHNNNNNTQTLTNQQHNQDKNRSTRQTWFISFISGAIAGTLAAILTHPFEVLKTAQQFQYNPKQLEQLPVDLSKAGLYGTSRYILLTRGFKGLFTGLLPRTLKIAPSCAVMLSSYDLTKTLFGLKPNIAASAAPKQH